MTAGIEASQHSQHALLRQAMQEAGLLITPDRSKEPQVPHGDVRFVSHDQFPRVISEYVEGFQNPVAALKKARRVADEARRNGTSPQDAALIGFLEAMATEPFNIRSDAPDAIATQFEVGDTHPTIAVWLGDLAKPRQSTLSAPTEDSTVRELGLLHVAKGVVSHIKEFAGIIGNRQLRRRTNLPTFEHATESLQSLLGDIEMDIYARSPEEQAVLQDYNEAKRLDLKPYLVTSFYTLLIGTTLAFSRDANAAAAQAPQPPRDPDERYGTAVIGNNASSSDEIAQTPRQTTNTPYDTYMSGDGNTTHTIPVLEILKPLVNILRVDVEAAMANNPKSLIEGIKKREFERSVDALLADWKENGIPDDIRLDERGHARHYTEVDGWRAFNKVEMRAHQQWLKEEAAARRQQELMRGYGGGQDHLATTDESLPTTINAFILTPQEIAVLKENGRVPENVNTFATGAFIIPTEQGFDILSETIPNLPDGELKTQISNLLAAVRENPVLMQRIDESIQLLAQKFNDDPNHQPNMQQEGTALIIMADGISGGTWVEVNSSGGKEYVVLDSNGILHTIHPEHPAEMSLVSEEVSQGLAGWGLNVAAGDMALFTFGEAREDGMRLIRSIVLFDGTEVALIPPETGEQPQVQLGKTPEGRIVLMSAENPAGVEAGGNFNQQRVENWRSEHAGEMPPFLLITNDSIVSAADLYETYEQTGENPVLPDRFTVYFSETGKLLTFDQTATAEIAPFPPVELNFEGNPDPLGAYEDWFYDYLTELVNNGLQAESATTAGVTLESSDQELADAVNLNRQFTREKVIRGLQGDESINLRLVLQVDGEQQVINLADVEEFVFRTTDQLSSRPDVELPDSTDADLSANQNDKSLTINMLVQSNKIFFGDTTNTAWFPLRMLTDTLLPISAPQMAIRSGGGNLFDPDRVFIDKYIKAIVRLRETHIGSRWDAASQKSTPPVASIPIRSDGPTQ